MVRHINDLRVAMKTMKDAHPFAILAMVLLFNLSFKGIHSHVLHSMLCCHWKMQPEMSGILIG